MAYSNAIFYIDLENGNDATRSTLTGATASPYYDTEGAELAPALTTGNWNLATGWQYLTSPDRLDKNADGTNSVTPASSITPSVGSVYKLVVTIDSISGGSLIFALGGTTFPNAPTTAGVYTSYVITNSTGNFLFYTPTSSSRCTISSISLKKITYNSTDNLPVKLTYTAHGQVTGSIVAASSFVTYINGSWKITKIDDNNFTLDTSVWETTTDAIGDVVPFGGGSWSDAWKTITSGATVARIAAGDTIRISKTPDPVSIGNATWTDCPSGGFNPTTVNISSSTNASPIEITTSSNHNLSTGDVVLVNGHAANYTANGNWQITYVSATKFTLDGSVGVATGSSGTARKVNSKAVVLATEQTQNVVTTEGGWTSIGDTTVTNSTLFAKSGYLSSVYTLDSSPQTSTLQAYRAIALTDFSTKQKLSFWIYNSATISADQWYIALCSDTSGATPVDVFKIPAIPSTARGIPLTLTKEGGGNLGSAIQSVAIYTDTVAPTASSAIRLDNILACSTLCLQSLISKNGSAQGGTEGYYGIQSINGKVVVLDNDTNTVSTAGRGYSTSGTSPETVETFIRSTFKTAMAASSSTQVSVLTDSGTLGNLIAYEFGYEVGTTNQNGETFLDGLNGNGHGIYSTNKNYNSVSYAKLVRYYNGVNNATSNHFLYSNISMLNCTNNGLSLSGNNNSINTTYITNSTNNGLSLSGNNNSINTGASKNILANGIQIGSTGTNNNLLYNFVITNNAADAVANYGNIELDTCLFENNGSGNSIYNYLNIVVRNTLFNDTVEVATPLFANNWLWSYDHDKTEGNNWGFSDSATVNWQTDTKHSSEAGAWKTAITSADRKSNYKAVLPVAEVAGIANTNLTVTAWVKKDHATDIACRLVCYADTSLNITEQSDTKADDTDWEQLSITLNSDHANPVFQIFLETWYVAGTSNSYVGTITVS